MPTILVVDDNKLSRMMVEQRLTKAGFTVITAESAIEALSRIRSRLISPDLVISDIVMPGMQGYDFCRELRQEPSTAQVPIILLTSKGGVQEKVAGFQAGADDYLVKPVEPAELVMRIRVLLARAKTGEATRETSTDKGKVITVFSLRGGAGVSTVTLNLAIALAQLWETEVSLIDLAMASSHLMMMLDLKPKYTIADLAEYQQSSELDGEAIGGFLTDHESGVRLLAGLHRPELVDLVSPSLVPTALSYLRDRFAYLVIDTDSSFSEHNLEVLDASDVIVLVVNPEMASMQSSTRALDVFASLGYSDDKIVAVLNWIFPKGGLPQKNIESALRKPIQTVIPYEETLFVHAINRGLPPVWKQPNAPASLVIQELAYMLSSLRHTTSPPQNPSEAWKRVQAYVQRKKR